MEASCIEGGWNKEESLWPTAKVVVLTLSVPARFPLEKNTVARLAQMPPKAAARAIVAPVLIRNVPARWRHDDIVDLTPDIPPATRCGLRRTKLVSRTLRHGNFRSASRRKNRKSQWLG